MPGTTPTSGEAEVRLRVICSPLPPQQFDCYGDIALGMQCRTEVRPGVERTDGAVEFECTARVQRHAKTGQPNFLGPWVHGTPEARFLYLNWTAANAAESTGFRRMKIHLASIFWEQIEAVTRSSAAVLEARVSGVGTDGSPACATVPLLDGGWTVREGKESFDSV